MSKKVMEPQDNQERQVILADMHDDGVHFNRELLAKQKKMRVQKAKDKKIKNKAKR